MGPKIYFHADSITVSVREVSIHGRVYRLSQIAGVHCEKSRIPWLWPLPVTCFALVLTTTAAQKVCACRNRNAYLIFQLVNAIQAALADAQEAAAPLAENSSA